MVTLWDVVEHTAEPAVLVGEALARLRPGGVLFIETPDAAFPARQMLLTLRSLTRRPCRSHRQHVLLGAQGVLHRTGPQHASWVSSAYGSVTVEHWTSPRAKMVKLLSKGGPQGVFAMNRAIARTYPLAQAGLERLGLGNKLIVVATNER